MKTTIPALMTIALLAGCSDSTPDQASKSLEFDFHSQHLIEGVSTCNLVMAGLIADENVGGPEEVNPPDGSSYNAVTGSRMQTWWYWSKGFFIDLQWSGDTGGCLGTIYTFAPQ